MQISKIRQKIIINFAASAILAAIVAATTYYHIQFKNSSEKEINQIKQATNKFKQEAKELKSKAAEFKKYSKMWTELSPLKKKLVQIKRDEIQDSASTIAAKYNIKEASVKIIKPEYLQQDIFKRTTIKVHHTTITLNYKSTNDVNSVLFIYEFLNSLAGQKVLSSVTVKKDSDYTKRDYQNIALGKSQGNITTQATIHWYAYENL